MFDYREARDDDSFDYGVVTYFDGDDEAVAAEGYIRGDVLRANEEGVITVVEPEMVVQIPVGRVVKIQYTGEEE